MRERAREWIADAVRPSNDDACLTRPTVTEIGELVTTYFASPDTWAKRHVETVTFRSTILARRQLTVDAVLPRDVSRSLPWGDGERLFYLPVTTIDKESPGHNLDLQREDGRDMPILSREENGEISATALAAAATQVLGGEPSQHLLAALRSLCCETGLDAERHNAVAMLRMMLEFPGWDPADSHLASLVRELSANWMVWVGVVGRPGERRVLKFSSDLNIDRLKIPARRTRSEIREVTIPDLNRTFSFEAQVPGDGNQRGTLRRIGNRLGAAVGLVAYEADFTYPYVRHTESYHLQVPAPDGIVTRNIELRAPLTRDGKPREPVKRVTQTYAHLSFRDMTVERMGNASVTMHVGHRGFLSHGLLACGLITFMLWLFWDAANRGVAIPAAEAIPVLLLVPALLAVFVVRPGEHAIATRLISGPRMLLMICGTLSVLDGLTLIGVEPFGVDRDSLWHASAIAATVLTGVMLFAWVLAHDILEGLRRRTRARWTTNSRYHLSAFALVLALDAFVLLTLDRDVDAGPWSWTTAGTLVVFGLCCGWTAFYGSDNRHMVDPSFGVAMSLWINCVSAIAVTPFVVGATMGPVDWNDARRSLGLILLIALATMTFSALRTLRKSEDDVTAKEPTST